ncbi:MAG TPA: glycosyltransferase family 4 protein [Polyangiaceae bacterium]|jgi:glycosyltransferase involved in cell wall biosynthesis
MRIGVVVQRYGLEVNGGAELLCRTHAEHLALRSEVEKLTVFTTCARDHQTWANHYPPGKELLSGVEVERFPVLGPRMDRAERRVGAWKSARLAGVRPLAFLEPAWFVTQGPVAPGLLSRLWAVQHEYDAFLFYTYLYFPTVFGLPLVARKSVLAPTAHDEAPIHMTYYRWFFRLPRAFAFLTPEEQSFLTRTFRIRQPSEVVATGISPPELDPQAPPLVDGPYVLYVGRVEPAKGIAELFAAFDAFKARCAEQEFVSPAGVRYAGKELKLILAGRVGWVDAPARDDVRLLGFISDADKARLLRDCQALLMPSRFESLSLVVLEAWSYGKPVLVNAECEATAGQVSRSLGGAAYLGPQGCAEALERLLSDPSELARMGELGRAYTERNYVWRVVEDRLLGLLRIAAGK